MSGGSKEEIATPTWNRELQLTHFGDGFQVPVDRLYVNICKYVIYSSIF